MQRGKPTRRRVEFLSWQGPLVLDDNEISDKGAKALAVLIAQGHLKSLSLSGNKIKVLGASALATALKSRKSRLTELSLSGNHIPRGGGDELKSALQAQKLYRDDHGVDQLFEGSYPVFCFESW